MDKASFPLYFVENVPCFVCEYCGEKSYSIKTLENIETIIDSIKEVQKANIIEYSAAA